jgi:Cys-rich protein (TIGR01571 family)
MDASSRCSWDSPPRLDGPPTFWASNQSMRGGGTGIPVAIAEPMAVCSAPSIVPEHVANEDPIPVASLNCNTMHDCMRTDDREADGTSAIPVASAVVVPFQATGPREVLSFALTEQDSLHMQQNVPHAEVIVIGGQPRSHTIESATSLSNLRGEFSSPFFCCCEDQTSMVLACFCPCFVFSWIGWKGLNLEHDCFPSTWCSSVIIVGIIYLLNQLTLPGTHTGWNSDHGEDNDEYHAQQPTPCYSHLCVYILGGPTANLGLLRGKLLNDSVFLITFVLLGRFGQSLRVAFKRKYHIHDDDGCGGNECLVSHFCNCCNLAQMARHIQHDEPAHWWGYFRDPSPSPSPSPSPGTPRVHPSSSPNPIQVEV